MHSSGIDGDGLVVETTLQRVTYFGVEMRDDLAAWFADWVEPLDTQPRPGLNAPTHR